MAPASAASTSPRQRAARTSTRCSTRIFFTLASRSGTTRIVYDLSKDLLLLPSPARRAFARARPGHLPTNLPPARPLPADPRPRTGQQGGRAADRPQACVQYRILRRAVNNGHVRSRPFPASSSEHSGVGWAGEGHAPTRARRAVSDATTPERPREREVSGCGRARVLVNNRVTEPHDPIFQARRPIID